MTRSASDHPPFLRHPLLRAGAACIEPLYSAAMRLRSAAYDRRWIATRRAHVPVISIGNLTTGGTGKTPMVVHTVQTLESYGARPAVILRGYRRDPAGTSDEQQLLRELLPGVPVVANPDRSAAARQLRAKHPDVNIIVLDDAFQHRRIHRDLDLVLIDATNPFGYDHVLPRGLMREDPSCLRRADAVIVTRADLLEADELSDLDRRIAALHGRPPIAHTAHTWSQLLDEHDQPVIIKNGLGRSAPTTQGQVRAAPESIIASQCASNLAEMLTLSGEELGPYATFKELRAKAYRYAKDHFLGHTVTTRSDHHAITISSKSIGKCVSGPRIVDELRAIPVLPQMVANSVWQESGPDRRGRRSVVAMHTRWASLTIAGIERRFILVISETKDGEKLYDIYCDKKQTPRVKSETGPPAEPARPGASEAAGSTTILPGNPADSTLPRRFRVFVLAGIGNPAAFMAQASQRFTIVDGKLLPDHARYTASFLDALAQEMAGSNVDAVLTTEKDWVKLRPLIQSRPLPVPVWRPRLSIALLDGEKEFQRRILAAIAP